MTRMYGVASREALRAEARVAWQREDGGYAVEVFVRRGDSEQLWGRRWPSAGRCGADLPEQALASAGSMLLDAGYMLLGYGDAWALTPAPPEWQSGPYARALDHYEWQCGTYKGSAVDFWCDLPAARKFGDLAAGDQA